MQIPPANALTIPRLGECRFPSPLQERGQPFVDENRKVLVASDTLEVQPFLEANQPLPAFEPAGPREQVFFAPQTLRCGIVTCGGICPGLNDVIRSIVLTLTYAYGVKHILGFRYGYAGLSSHTADEPLRLTPEIVATIHQQGGTLLGSSRGSQDIGDMVDTLVRDNVGVLFALGGDGTLRGASALSQEITRRKLSISIIGIPKTIDNDLAWIERCFGFATAVEEATRAITAAHTEARGALNGIGLVKLMGRHSGFIAAHASLANSDVNFCLVPEVPFTLDGEGGFLTTLERRLARKRHAVVVVAEGAGQDMFSHPANPERDASGNVRLQDTGIFLRDRIPAYLKSRGRQVTLKYIDPSYIIRSLPANALDSEFCLMLGQHAVHAGMAGRTDVLIGYWNQRFTHLPIALAVDQRKQLMPHGEVWQSVLEATGQPAAMGGDQAGGQ